jgi:hypothetical protein
VEPAHGRLWSGAVCREYQVPSGAAVGLARANRPDQSSSWSARARATAWVRPWTPNLAWWLRNRADDLSERTTQKTAAAPTVAGLLHERAGLPRRVAALARDPADLTEPVRRVCAVAEQ